MLLAFKIAALTLFCYMTTVFVLSLVLRDNSIADIAYGGGFIAGAAGTAVHTGVDHPRQMLLLLMIATWGLRLAAHIFTRNRGRPEDFRYRAWREKWGRYFIVRSYLQIYILQGFVILVVLSPVVIVLRDPGGPISPLDAAGLAVWLTGLFFEAVGDWQLLVFLRDPANRDKILQEGLWRYTRHPNYFGEATLWWGIFLIALGSPFGWIGVVSPLTIDFLLLKVSGIPMLEEKYRGNPEFEKYRRRTNAFFPWVPRRGGA